jgi:Protein of unknown function (DUF998)
MAGVRNADSDWIAPTMGTSRDETEGTLKGVGAMGAERHPAGVERLAPQVALAWAGILGPALFTAAFLAQEAFRRDECDPLAEPVSALEAGPNGWIQQVNFVVFGLLTIAFALGLHGSVRRTRAGIAGPAFLLASGVGLLLAAVLPLWRTQLASPMTPAATASRGSYSLWRPRLD